MSKNFVYSRSYYGIFLALYLKSLKKEVAIITSSNDLISFCNLIKLEVIKVEDFKRNEFVKNRKQIKEASLELIKKMGDGILHFSHKQYDLFCFYLVKEYAKKNEVLFYPIEFLYKSDKINDLKMLLSKYILSFRGIAINLVYGLNVKVIAKTGLLLYAIDDKFIKRHNIKRIEFEKPFEEIKSELFRNNQVSLFKSRNLLITQNLENFSSIITGKSLEKLNEYLNSIDISIKNHPNMKEKNIFEKKNVYPSYIPAELIYSNIENAVLSVESLALVSAALNPRIKSISLLNLVDWVDVKYKNEVEIFLRKESNDKILFPKSFNELSELI